MSLAQTGGCNFWVMINGSVCVHICICSCPEFFHYLCWESTGLRHQSAGRVMQAGRFLFGDVLCSVLESCKTLISR